MTSKGSSQQESGVGLLPIMYAYAKGFDLADWIDVLLNCEMEAIPGLVLLALTGSDIAIGNKAIDEDDHIHILLNGSGFSRNGRTSRVMNQQL